MRGRIIRQRKASARQYPRLRSFCSSVILFLLFCPPLFCPLFSGIAEAADSPDLSISRVEIGFGGKYRSGFWTPISITLSLGSSPLSGDLQLVSQDGDNVPVVFFSAGQPQHKLGIGLDATKGNRETTLSTYVKFGPHKSRLSLRMIDRVSGKILWQSPLPKTVPAPLSATTPLIVTLGPSVGVDDALKFTRRSQADSLVAAEVKSAEHLPRDWWGYEGVETIFLPTGSGSILGDISPRQSEALRQWVHEGGRLVICSGVKASELAAENSVWKELVPGQLVEVAPMRDAATLESLSSEAFPFTDDASRPLVARLSAVRGKVELSQGPRAADVPLVIKSHDGFGEVTFVTFDLDGERFAKWAGRPRLVASLIRESKGQEQSAGAATLRLGYTDLTGQLRGALDQFPGVQLVNFTTVAILIIAYILLIGPLDYLVSQRLGYSRWLTWLTFPLLATLFCGIAWYAAGRSHGSVLRLNQAEIVDIDEERGYSRGTAWLHLYSPATKTYDVSLRPAAAAARKGAASGHLSWQGLPGGGLGGLEAQQVAVAATSPYEIEYPSGTPGLKGLPIQVGSSKSLAARWTQELSLKAKSQVSLNEHGVPIGDLVNPLDVELEECIFTYKIWMFRLKKLGLGQRFSLSDSRLLNLESRLQQHTGSNFTDSATPWLRDSTDVPAILQMLMYHEAAKGSAYTGLTHRYQPHLDMTSQLASRGVLVGRAAKPASELLVDGSGLAAEQIQSWTYYRIVIPISPNPPATSTAVTP